MRAPWTLLALLLLLSSCRAAADDLAVVRRAAEAGDDEATEETLRDALERHPDDVELLLFAADFYLRPEAEDRYKPRLSLHYAMRADRAAGYGDPRATRAMTMAHRGAGSVPVDDAPLRDALASVGHPDAGHPVRLDPVDPDLLEPTLPHLLEQRRRQKEGRPQPTCREGMLLVPAGDYGSGLDVADHCVEVGGRPVALPCEPLGLRECTATEAAVAAGPVAGLLEGPPGHARCCEDPVVRRVLPAGAQEGGAGRQGAPGRGSARGLLAKEHTLH